MPAAVAIADAGELTEVREILWELGIEFEELSKGGPRPNGGSPERMLITTVALATAGEFECVVRQGARKPTWIAIATQESLSHRNRLVARGFDYLVRMPIHPAALRMLFATVLFEGEETRTAPRVAVGYPVTYKKGWLSRRATLVDLSGRGARIFTPRAPMPTGTELTLMLPAPLIGGSGLELAGKVVRSQLATAEQGPEGHAATAIRFRPMKRGVRQKLADLIERLGTETAQLPDEGRRREEEDAGPVREPRGMYERAVLAYGSAGGPDLLRGRNLSSGGMSVEAHECLREGASVRIALEDDPEQPPFLVTAQVIRDDGASGMALKFMWIEEGAEERLAALVESLPAIEGLSTGTRSSSFVLSRLMPSSSDTSGLFGRFKRR